MNAGTEIVRTIPTEFKVESLGLELNMGFNRAELTQVLSSDHNQKRNNVNIAIQKMGHSSDCALFNHRLDKKVISRVISRVLVMSSIDLCSQ
jgi:hypothetical protein